MGVAVSEGLSEASQEAPRVDRLVDCSSTRVKILNSLSPSLHSLAETCRTPVGQSSSPILCQSSSFSPSSAGTSCTPAGQSSFPLSTSSSALELSSARNSSFGNAASVLCDFVELAPLGSSLTETLVELSYDAHVLLPGQASSIQARFSFFDASVGYTAEILQEFLERVGSYHWAILAPKGSGIFQEFINMLAVVLLRLRWVCFWLQDKETLQIGIIGFNFLGLEVGVLSCYPTHPYWQAGSTLEFLLHLLGYSSVWHRWRVGRAWARSSTTQTWTDTLHFAVLCLELGGA